MAATVSAEEKEEPPEACHNCIWPAAVAERYERHEKLGEGMFGDVHKAWDRVGKCLVAVKRLSGRGDERFLQTGLLDFAREAMSLAACRGHPAVVELVATHADSGRRHGDCFIVTEYAGALNLREHMALRLTQTQQRRRRPPFREAEVRRAMRQLLAGAEHVHAAGVLHRDMVPDNVLVDEKRKGNVVYKIGGFGMSEPAARADRDGSAALASASPYRAPELFLGSKDYDSRVDTWALGCVMAELLAGAGKPFFAAGSDADVFEKVQQVVGTEGILEWPGLRRLAGRDVAAELRDRGCQPYAGCLREVFPEKVLSEEGFEVLRGLLDPNPERRLTADDALRKPWFRHRRHSFRGCCFVP